MDVMIVLKLLYKTILISPVLLTLTYLLLTIYDFKQDNGGDEEYLTKFLYGTGALVSYGIATALISKASRDQGYTVIDKIGMPIILFLLSLLYLHLIVDAKNSFKRKLGILIALPCFPGIVILIEKVAGSL